MPPLPDQTLASRPPSATPRTRLLITAGPTHEPVDAVRFLGNRSSGRMGVALAEAAAADGGHPWDVRLLLGPAAITPTDSRVTVRRFRTCSDLEQLLAEEAPAADVIIMAAAVADYRPKPNPALSGGKFRRTNMPLMLELEPTPDLIAAVSARRRDVPRERKQMIVGFALEPRAELLASARSKLERKGLDLVVGNPLETMDSETVEAVLVSRVGDERTPGVMSKRAFAGWVLARIVEGYRGMGGG